jgi:hypothetical protein
MPAFDLRQALAGLVARAAKSINYPAGCLVGGIFFLVEPMTVHIAEAAERRESVACRHCPAKAELIVSMISPKDGRTLRVCRCRCRKLHVDRRLTRQ